MLRDPSREPAPVCSALNRIAVEVMERVEAGDQFLEGICVSAPENEAMVRSGMSRRLEKFGLDGVDVRVSAGESYALVSCGFAKGR